MPSRFVRLELVRESRSPVEQTLHLLCQLLVAEVALSLELQLIGPDQRVVELERKAARLEELLQRQAQSLDVLLGILDTLVAQKVARNLDRTSIDLCSTQ